MASNNTSTTNPTTKGVGKKESIFIISVSVSLCILALVAVILLIVRTHSKNNKIFAYEYKTTTQVGYEMEELGTVKRNIPTTMKNEGLPAYPQYGSTLRSVIGSEQDKQDARTALIEESNYLTTSDTRNGGGAYQKMDAQGYLYTSDGTPVLDSQDNPRQLYKHTASVGMYLGDVADDEPAIARKFTYRYRGYGQYYDLTGMYAPAGEVLKVQLTEEDMNATGGVIIHIGQALYNRKANNIWTAKNAMNRMPVILNTFYITKQNATLENGIYTAYIGSYLGGPVYVMGETATYSITISGGVRYSHFILGYTTKEEFERNAQSSAPYFDLEVWDTGVLHSGPKYYAKNFSYDQIYEAGVLWDKIAHISTYKSKQGIVFLYDPFVAAGAAVAFPTQGSVNCPMDWMPSSLNVDAFVRGGAWGNMHEYNHNFQNYGVGYTGEVTNNGLNLVEYSLFTKISSSRQVAAYGGAGLSGWNCYTSAPWALQRVNAGQITGTDGLAVYATLLHNLGQHAFMESTGTSGANYFNKWAANTHQDFSYYADLISAYAGSLSLATNDYPMFVPVSSVYQTGRSYLYDNEKRYITTMQPYVINYGQSFTVDLNPYQTNAAGQYESGSIVIGNGFKYSIKNVDTSQVNGSFVRSGNNIYTFTPNQEINSGKIIVTLEITTTDGAHTYNGKALNDVDLVLEFEQTHENTKFVLERTTYTYTPDTVYATAKDAYESNYAGYTQKTDINHTNPTQNSNTDIWYYPVGDSHITDSTPEHYVVPLNSVAELRGKLYIAESGKYRIAFRGRWNCALYLSFDGGKTYTLPEEFNIVNKTTGVDIKNCPHKDYDNLQAGDWIYFKAVMITAQNRPTGASQASFFGLGLGKFEQMGGTIEGDASDHEELEETVSVGYATGYRQSYESINRKFETEYFYTKDYDYDYIDNRQPTQKQELVTIENYTPYSSSRDKVENLVDGNVNTYIHTNASVSEKKPLICTVDLGSVVPANRMVLYTQYRGNGDYLYPVDFIIYGSCDGQEYFEIKSVTNAQRSGTTITVNFDEVNLRYYRIKVTKDTGYCIICKIDFMRIFELFDGSHESLDKDQFTFKGVWSVASSGTFGHVYQGKKNAKLTFEFTGKQLAIMTKSNMPTNYKVYIDGKEAKSMTVKEDKGLSVVSFLSSELENKTHTVEIKCTGKGATFDSIVVW